MDEIQDFELLAYLDGEAGQDVAARIERSPDALLRVRVFASVQKTLREGFYRVDCPDTALLGEYSLGMLLPGRALKVVRHLALCPYCREEMDRAYQFIGPGLVARIKVLIAKRVEEMQGRFSNLAPAFGVRGAEVDPYVYQADGVQIAIDVQEDRDQPNRRTVIGLIMGVQAQEYRVSILQDDLPRGTVNVDDLGNFYISDLERGEYELLIRGPKVEIYVQTFTV